MILVEQNVFVNMGHASVSDDINTVLDTFVGSCIALCLYDERKKIGGLAHIMLPLTNKSTLQENKLPAKFANHAIEYLLNTMMEKGANNQKIIAKMAGGATMFFTEAGYELPNIGKKTIDSIRDLLWNEKITICADELGNTCGRKVSFQINTGNVIVKNRQGEQQIL